MVISVATAGALPVTVLAQVNRYYVGNGADLEHDIELERHRRRSTGASVPANGDTAWVTGALSTNVPFDGNYASPGLGAIYLDGTGGATITLSQTSSSTDLAALNEFVGYSGNGIVDQSEGRRPWPALCSWAMRVVQAAVAEHTIFPAGA